MSDKFSHKYYLNSKNTVEKHAKLIFNNRKRKAKKEGIEFSVTFEEMLKVVPEFCPALNIKLAWCETNTGIATNNSPSLDKYDPKLGYISGNVFWVSYRANRIKFDANAKEIQAVANWMKQIENQQ